MSRNSKPFTDKKGKPIYKKDQIKKQQVKILNEARKKAARARNKKGIPHTYGTKGSRNSFQKEADYNRILQWLREGKTELWISRELNISPTQAHKDIIHVLNMMVDMRMDNVELYRAKLMGHLEHVIHEAGEAWEHSKEDKEKIETTQRVADAVQKGVANIANAAKGKASAIAKPIQRKVETTMMTVEGQNGDPRFLTVILNAADSMKQLLGLEKPAPAEPTDAFKTIEDARSLIESRLAALAKPVNPPPMVTNPDGEQVEVKVERLN